MNYGKAKKILIFLFLFLNLFLIFQLMHLSKSDTKLNPDSVEKTIALLKKNNISADKKDIPKSVEILDYLELYNPMSDEKAFFSTLSGKEKRMENNTFFLTESIPIENENQSAILSEIRKAGFKNNKYIFSHFITNDITGEKKYYFRQTYNDYPITGSYICASVSKNTITEISGSVYKALTVKYTDYQILSPLQILLDIGASYSGKGAEYKAFSQSYYISPDALSYTNLTAIPCNVLNVNDNNLFYDSVTGEFLKMDTQNGGTIYEKEEAFSYLSK